MKIKRNALRIPPYVLNELERQRLWKFLNVKGEAVVSQNPVSGVPTIRESLTVSAFVGTNPTAELITSGLPELLRSVPAYHRDINS
jgi:hypothetical protein